MKKKTKTIAAERHTMSLRLQRDIFSIIRDKAKQDGQSVTKTIQGLLLIAIHKELIETKIIDIYCKGGEI